MPGMLPAEVQQALASLGPKNPLVGTLSPREAARIERERARIVSIAPYCCRTMHAQGVGFYQMKACPPGTPYVVDEIKGFVAYKSFGDDHYEPVVVEAEEVAEDIVHGALPGCFKLDEGQLEPTVEQLAACREKMEKFGREEVGRADEEWAKRHQPRDVSGLAKYFSEHFQLSRDWSGQVKHHETCEACKKVLIPGALICTECRYPTDWQRAYDMGALTAEWEERGKRIGKIKDKDQEILDAPTPGPEEATL